MLLGREQERLAIDRVLAEAHRGRSGVVALVGEPGIGKTALLEHAADAAADMRPLRARGVESEADVPFAGLAELLRPALACIDRVPAPQAAALSGALALGPAAAGDRFAIGAATLSLLSAYADDGPLLLVVDDVHLLDRASAEALLFAFRRLVDDPIAVVLAAREGEPSLLDGADLRILRVGGLTRPEAGALLAGLPDGIVDRVYRATGGNPLALRELAADAAALADEPLDAPVPLSASIAATFARRLERLPEPTRALLLLAAAGGGRDVSVLARAAAETGADVADLAAAEESGLVRLAGGTVEFTHPLVRAAAYADASAADRRGAHAALAAATPEADADRRAWHLAAAAVGPDAGVSAALEAAGGRAHDRSAYAAAARAYERAARLAPADDARGRLLHAAADAAWLDGDAARAEPLLDEARLHTTDVGVLARVDRLRGHVLMRRGPVSDGAALLADAAERAAQSDPDLAVIMLGESVEGSFYAGDTAAMVAAADRAGAIVTATASHRARFFAEMAVAMASVAEGDGERGAGHARTAVAILEASAELRDDPRLATWATLAPLYLREAEAGRELIERASAHARARGAVGTLPAILHMLARDQATTDRWADAEANLDEAIRLADETGQRTEFAAALAGLAWLQAREGREAECRANAARAVELTIELGMGTYAVWAIQALGDLDLGLGRPADSIQHHEAQAATLRERGIADVDLSPAPELVDAYLRLGRADEARAAGEDYAAAAEAKGQPWALARAARCRGMLASDDAFEHAFADAIALHGRTLDAFETGRTRLAFGGRLRRAKQRARSRQELRAALETFEQLGAEPWAEQARAELAATGETARRRDPSTLDDLTPQEFQIARMLASGMTTRETAAAAFLSPKTVEYHLRNTYRKLGIRSRDELADRLARRVSSADAT
jgi:DNA-binding CsgD family transcriptional regulator